MYARSMPGLLSLCLLLSSSAALAQIQGTLNVDTTWSGAISMTGDVTVAAGKTLTIQPGTVITAATTDGQGSGTSTSSVELIVNGTLNVQGSSSNGVTFTGAGTGTSAWWGVRVAAGGSATVSYARFEEMSAGVVVDGTAAISNSVFAGNSTGLAVTNGTNTFSNNTYSGNTSYGVRTTGGTSSFTASLFTGNSSYGLYFNGGVVTFDHNTMSGNSGSYAIYSYSSSSANSLSVTNSIIANNSSYGLYRASSDSSAVSNDFNDVWGNSSGNYSSYISAGGNSLSANPLFVSTTNLRITSNSPCRKAGSGGATDDLGALAYGSDATSGLQGTLFTNTTLTGANTVLGDLTVNPGVTLTVSPGATLTFSTTDSMGSGASTSLPELIVKGTLSAAGTQGSPLLFTGAGTGTSAWYGVRVAPGGSATVTFATFEEMSAGVVVEASSSISNSTFRGSATGLALLGGTNTFLNDAFSSNTSYGVRSTGGSSTITGSLFTGNSSYAFYFNGGQVTFDHNTLANNSGSYAIYSYSSSSANSLSITNTIIANNSAYGLYRASSDSSNVTNDFNDVWGNSSGNYSSYISAGGSSISTNPLFVSASNLRLTSNSPCRMAGTTSSDIGALPYVSDPTSGLQGTLYVNTTLSGANPVLGDLTVAPGVTLTIQPGATLTFSTTDSMGAGASTSLPELIVRGTLSALGTSDNNGHVLFTGAGTGTSAWYGVRVQAGGSATVSYGTFEEMSAGVMVEANTSISNSTFNGNGTGLALLGGTNTFSGDTFSANTSYGVRSTGGSSTISGSLFTGNSSYGFYFNGGQVTFDHNTLANNSGSYAIYTYSSSSANTLSITNSIIASNSAYGLYRASSDSSNVTNNYNDVWGNSSGNYSSYISAGGNSFSANPLFVSGSNLRLTSNSPCRMAGTSGSDVGALPYLTDATVGLQGTLYVNTTLSGANAVIGDVTVAPGVTLTIQPGATLTFSTTDTMGAGSSTSLPELIVKGTLSALGTSTSGITFTGAGTGTSAWYGVQVLAGGGASVSFARFEEMSAGVIIGATSSITNSIFTGNGTGLAVTGGSASTFSNNTYSLNSSYGVRTTGGSATINWSVFTGNTSYAMYFNGGAVTFDHNTVVTNSGSYGLYLYSSSSANSLSLTNSIVASNSAYGVYRASSDSSVVTNDYNDVWGNSSGNYSSYISAGVHSISSNPNFVDAPNGNFHLGATSPCVGAAQASTDMGAFPFSLGAVDHLVVAPSTTSVPAGGQVGFSATAYDVANNPIPGTVFTWTALAAAGTITSPGGILTAACTPGTVAGAVTASANGRSASASVTITLGTAASVVVSPASATVKSQDTQSFTAVVRDSCNNPLTGAVTWSVTGSAGTITNPAGLYTAGCSRGAYPNAIVATAGSRTGTASVTVSPGDLSSLSISPTTATIPANGQQQFTGNGADGCGNPVSPTVGWTTTVTGGSVVGGLLTAGGTPGTYPNGVTASATAPSGALTASANVTVSGGAIATVTVSPATATLAAGATQQFTAEARDSVGNVVPGAVTWAVTANGGTITSGGLFTAGTTAGVFTGTVRATIGGVNGTASVTVQAGAVDHVSVTPATATLAPGGSTTFLAQAYDANNNPLTGTVTWSALAAAGTITPGGVFTAGGQAGTFNNAVTATVGAVTGSASVTVSSGALSQLTIQPAVASVAAGATVGFTVQGRDAAGNPVAVTPTWSVINGGGTINASGVFTAGNVAGSFANTVKAEAQGLTAFATANISPGPAVVIEVTPNFPQLMPGAQQQFLAQARDAFGNPVASSPAWSASPAAGTINAAGLFTCGATPGDFPGAVTATANGLSGSATVRVLTSDGGVVVTDGGADAGADAGTDAGFDAGSGTDGGGEVDSGVHPDGGPGSIVGNNRGTGCSCNATDASLPFALLGLLAAVRRRSRKE